MRKLISFLLVWVLILALCACVEQAPPETSAQTTAPTTAPTTVPAQPTETTVPEAPEAAFDGYEYLYEDQRDASWEQDIVYMARLYLGEYVVKGHPKLTARLVSITDMNNRVTQRYFYDAALREEFVAQIYELIAAVPELTDNEIVYELRRIVALIGDAHSQLGAGSGEYFPFIVEQMEKDGEVGLYVTRIPNTGQKLIYSELVSINGIPIEEVVQRLSAYVSTENEYWTDTTIISIYNEMLIASKSSLQAAGVVAPQEDTATFGFNTGKGDIVELVMEAVELSTGEYWNVFYVDRTQSVMNFLSYSRYGDANYFYDYLAEYDTVYIRLYNISEVAEYRLEDMLMELDQELRTIGAVHKIVVDVRDNPGGYIYFADTMIKFLDEAEAENIYIIIDGGSFSGATIFPHRAKAKLDNVTLVGTPSGQPVNFFAGASTYNLKKHPDVYFGISGSYFEGDHAFAEAALMPDLLIWQSVKDYKKGIDTALQTVLDMD